MLQNIENMKRELAVRISILERLRRIGKEIEEEKTSIEETIGLMQIKKEGKDGR